MLTRYFGEPWPLITEPAQQVPVPADVRCTWCRLVFLDDEQGVVLPRPLDQPDADTEAAYHRQCLGVAVLG